VPTATQGLIYRIGAFEVDVPRAILRRDGEVIRLTPKSFQILVWLIANRHRLVTRDELLERFWPGIAVTDDSLAKCIYELRRCLADNSRDPRFLETVPKMGYRFIAHTEEVRPAALVVREEITTVEIREEIVEDPPARLLPAPARQRFFWPGAAAVVAVLMAAAWLAGAMRRPGPPPVPEGKRQIAILPFENLSGAQDIDWLRGGLPDMLTASLSHSRGLDVLSREQVAHWIGRAGRGAVLDAIEVARRSHARLAVTGSFARLGNSIRIDARVYDGRTGAMLAAQSVTADRLDHIVEQVDFLGVSLAARIDPGRPGDRAALASLMTDNLEAWRCYSAGLRAAESFQTDQAVAWFEKAVALDPRFAMALARTGYALSVTGGRLDAGKPYLERAFAMADRLTEKDRRHIAAWYAIAAKDYPEAIRRYSELVAAYPNESESYFRLANLLEGESRHEEGLVVARRALALDPDDPKLHNILAKLYSEMGRHSDAIEAAGRYVALAPAEANAFDSLGLAYQFAGEFQTALDAYDKALSLDPRFEIARLHRGQSLELMGRERDALRLFLAETPQPPLVPPARFAAQAAWLHWRRGRMDEARAAMDRALRDQAIANTLRWHPATLLVPGQEPFSPPEGRPGFGRGARYAARLQYVVVAEQERLRNRHDERLALLREGLRFRPSWGMQEPLEDALADALLDLGHLDEAIAEYERALTAFPGMAQARYRLASAYLRKGNTEAAKTQYRRFLELWKDADPDLPDVQDARRKLAD
jgi:tetratricopeptide (TPR) repeat protein/DNA-binding winged helix-turn-helix (wHTH) protein